MKLGEKIQLIGCIVTSMGIGIEIGTEAHLGYILISLGSLLWAVGVKITHTK